MEYNVCNTCGAKDGRCGILVNGECQNCSHTREIGHCILHTDLPRTGEEVKRTFAILETDPRWRFVEGKPKEPC